MAGCLPGEGSILLTKILFMIFSNDQLTAYGTIGCARKEKIKEGFFLL